MIKSVIRSWNLLTTPEKRQLSILAVFRATTNILDLLGIGLIGYAGAIALGVDNGISFLPDIDFSDRYALSFVLIVAAGLFASKSILGVLLSRSLYAKLAQIESVHSDDLLTRILGVDFEDLKSDSAGEIEWATLRSTQIAFSLVLGKAVDLFAEATLAVSILAILIIADWPTALGATLYFSAMLGAFYLYSRVVLSSAGAQYTTSSMQFADHLADVLRAYKEISIFRTMPYFLGLLSANRSQLARANGKNLYLASIPRLIVETGLIVGTLGFVGFYLTIGSREEDWVTLGVFLFAGLRMMSALLPIQRSLSSLRYESELASTAQSLLENFRERPLPSNGQNEAGFFSPDNNSPKPTPKGLSVDLKNVSFQFKDSPEDALKDVNLTIESGENIAIIGPSGSGKTTLLELILGLKDPTSGHALLDGFAAKFARRDLRLKLAYVPQKPALIRGSIAQNVAIGIPSGMIDHRQVEFSLRQAQLLEFVQSLPDGSATVIDKHLDSLSGGQMQRLGLARALYVKPQLLALDEPTSALDGETESAITENLHRLNSTMTVITIAHRISTIRRAEKVFFVEGGRLTGSGSFAEIRRDRRFSDYLRFLDQHEGDPKAQ